MHSKVTRSGVAALLTLCLMMLAPVTLLTPHELYKGYIATNVYHNPTITLAKPLALALFIVMLLVFHGAALQKPSQRLAQRQGAPVAYGARRWLIIAAVALLAVLSALAKPSFTLCLLPSIGIYVAVCLVRKARFDYPLLFAGIVLPSICVLLWQYTFTYSDPEFQSQSSIIFAPFLVFGHYVATFGDGVIRFVMSIAFPAVVALLYLKEVLHDRALRLAWLLFWVGAAYSYLLAETGERATDGNFLWCAQIALYIVFVFTVRFMLLKYFPLGADSAASSTVTSPPARMNIKPAVVALLFIVHVVCGVWWYAVHFNGVYVG
ncbi:MAG: hypothetical protein WCD37_00330 [Chloroflexia bacterium]